MATTQVRTPTNDIRKRMDDVYNEMQQASRGGRLRLPLLFLHFHETDVMYQFTRAAVGYALAYVHLQTIERDHRHHSSGDSDTRASPLQQHHQERPREEELSQQQLQQQRLREDAIASHRACATQLAESYARLVLHCSNFENHKQDERFFECVYYFVCAVVKLGVAAQDHWRAIENELGFLFRGAQFSGTIQRHSDSKTQREQAAAAAVALIAVNEAASGANTAAKKIQNLSATSASTKGDAGSAVRGDGSPFVLPTVPTTRCCFFPASLPVGKIVAALDAAKVRAARNIEISQSIRDRIRATREEESNSHPQQLDALVSPRVGMGLDYLKERETSGLVPQKPRRHVHSGGSRLSPRVSMRGAFTSRSPAVNHLLPSTEDLVRRSLEQYERGFQCSLQQQKLKASMQQRLQLGLDKSPTSSDLSSSASNQTVIATPVKPPPLLR